MRSRILNILEMKKFMTSLLILFFCLNCSQKQEKAKRITEEGVEVVVNYTDPHKITGQPTTIELRKEFSIDTKKDTITELGLVDIGNYFDVDLQGHVYLVSPMGKGNTIFKFDKQGNFISSFGHRGQGPGELVSRRFPPLFLTIHKEDQIIVTNYYRRKLVYFNLEGDFIREEKGIRYIEQTELGNLSEVIRSCVENSEINTREMVNIFSWENIAQNLMRIYMELISN